VFRSIVAALGRGLFALGVLMPVMALVVSHALSASTGVWNRQNVQAPSSPDSAAQAPADRLKSAATAFAGAAAGTGMTFQVVQSSVLYAKPGGPQIEIPDPADRYRSLGYTDRLYIGGLVADGTIARDGFYLAMRDGPATENGPVDLAGPLEMAALIRSGQTWRNDGAGWYETKTPPGIGLDSATVALLPRLLRQATAATLAGSTSIDGQSADLIRASGTVANAPGLLAIDGAPFTELREPIAFALDSQGRLVQLSAVERNTNSDAFDLIVTTTITFRYGAVPALPLPAPLAPPPVAPSAEPGDQR
jgi:cytochrome c-type biogenesis protein CcmE